MAIPAFFAVALVCSGAWVWWEYDGQYRLAVQRVKEDRHDEWHLRAEELRAYYAQQPGATKSDPPQGTALAHFVNLSRSARDMPQGLSDWKIRELEAIEGWCWE